MMLNSLRYYVNLFHINAQDIGILSDDADDNVLDMENVEDEPMGDNVLIVECIEVPVSVFTMSVTRKALSVSEKLKILRKYDKNSTLNQKQLSDSLGIPSSTLRATLKKSRLDHCSCDVASGGFALFITPHSIVLQRAEMTLSVDRCCCGCSLRTGTIIIGAYILTCSVVMTVFGSVCLAVVCELSHRQDFNVTREEDIPAQEITKVDDAFAELMSIVSTNDLEFADYMLNTYVGGDSLFPPPLWAAEPSDGSRTINGPESFHSFTILTILFATSQHLQDHRSSIGNANTCPHQDKLCKFLGI
ncbi:hypothetical protein ANN_03055 [Periplaneta americana]|uniref:Uncharacterized protein n=1 Tax=Periplaneta americana TaxID=6978 RepID=A0ABQ8TXZ0_PERAM|nr:hypothetical protein ANN_03055 [Periplaneta americana]